MSSLAASRVAYARYLADEDAIGVELAVAAVYAGWEAVRASAPTAPPATT